MRGDDGVGGPQGLESTNCPCGALTASPPGLAPHHQPHERAPGPMSEEHQGVSGHGGGPVGELLLELQTLVEGVVVRQATVQPRTPAACGESFNYCASSFVRVLFAA